MSIEAMKLMVAEMEYVLDCINKNKMPFDGDDFHEALRLGRQAIEQAQKQEPVAWANPHDLQNFDMKVRTNGGPLHTVPLYTSPPQRQPLSDEQVWDAYMEISAEFDCNVIDLVEFARAIEQAHGIEEQA